jgi:hypothetical protein
MTGSSGRSSIPETLKIKSHGRGVLDTPLSRGMTVVGRGAICQPKLAERRAADGADMFAAFPAGNAVP